MKSPIGIRQPQLKKRTPIKVHSVPHLGRVPRSVRVLYCWRVTWKWLKINSDLFPNGLIWSKFDLQIFQAHFDEAAIVLFSIFFMQCFIHRYGTKKAGVFASNRNIYNEMIKNRTIAASKKLACLNICRSNLLQIKPLRS